MHFDKEMEALYKCSELFNELEDEGRLRVVKYLVDRFKIYDQSAFDESIRFQESSQNNRFINSASARTNTSKNEHVEDFEISDETENNQQTDSVVEDVPDYPTLNDLMIKDYPKNEPEWMLVFAYYSSNFGSSTFTKSDLRDRYREIGRYSKSCQNNFNNNFASGIKKDWFKSVAGDKLIVKEPGKEYVLKIISGNSEGRESRRGKPKSKSKK